jgi:hypothetical protein
MAVSLSDLTRAARLTRAGKLGQASRLVQRALGLAAPPVKRARSARAKPNEAAAGAAASGASTPAAGSGGRFTRHVFRFGAERYAYRLFEPDPPAGGVAIARR